ncbi:hypothetical protein AnigIFM63604_009669 [Aspergillus niger]|uniref:Uncharacterized protein n=1 Tax=Aspergillus niger TaxID=5061 RepID=A0A9W6A6M4_ASPNG|nr:hypothetical protein CBS147323_5527 [Aspergillus niger]KAI3028626.1 hypothetical protein CBS147347_3880 [Aspergillus niger]KAI3043036.1 hypothetical protein CBS147352_8840 [Aspergillus niger]GLA52790.1 hypothetical protein AnigIFM63604_009669 [Aspergillus niger]
MAAPRVLVASGTLSGVDHEIFGSNELMHQSVHVRVVLTEDGIPQSLASWSKGWGGECYLEVNMTAQLQENRHILVTVNGKLFEGTDETPTDLEDEKTQMALVPRGGLPVPFTMQLNSSGFGGGDSATISVTFVNTIAEG